MPTCHRCGAQHYNFAACLPREDKKPLIAWNNDVSWKSSFHSLHNHSGQTFWQLRGDEWRHGR